MIDITLAPCLSVSRPFAAGAKEPVTFHGLDVPEGTKVGIFDGAGVCLAVADVQGNAATLDLDTQEAFDALAGVAVGETATVWCVVGNEDSYLATITARLLRNELAESAHPPWGPDAARRW